MIIEVACGKRFDGVRRELRAESLCFGGMIVESAALVVAVQEQHFFAELSGECGGQQDADGGLPYPTLSVGDGDNACRFTHTIGKKVSKFTKVSNILSVTSGTNTA